VEFSSGSIMWNVSFARAAHDWEVDAFILSFRVLYVFFFFLIDKQMHFIKVYTRTPNKRKKKKEQRNKN